VVIVGSILLAFGIDAAWEERQDRKEEQEILRSLRDDFVANEAALSGVLGAVSGSRIAYDRLARAEPEAIHRWAPDSVSTDGLIGVPTFDPYSGTVDALVSAGELDLIRDTSLRGILVGWLQGIDDLLENVDAMRAEAARVDHAMEPLGGPFFYPTGGGPDMSALPQLDAETLAALRSSEVVMGAARSHQQHVAFYRNELENLTLIVDSALILVDQNIR